MADLIHQLILQRAQQSPDADALSYKGKSLTYAALAAQVNALGTALPAWGLGRGERLAVYLEKCCETVISLFGTAAAGGTFVPVNPLLKPDQVGYILNDCNVSVLVTSVDRLNTLIHVLPQCPDLRTVVVLASSNGLPFLPGLHVVHWEEIFSRSAAAHRRIDSDMAAILYTSGSTGKPKGVVLSHRNLVAGAASVASYLENTPQDRILSVLPLSFDYGLSQLTTAFHSGACAVMMNYLLPRDIIKAVEQERITGLAAVPPLWMQLAQQRWEQAPSLRYITNSGGTLPRATLQTLRHLLPGVKVYLMYGLTEAFRSTYLPPSELDRRPDSIGMAIPNADILVVRADGTPCCADEPGELVHRGALVSLGYWNDPARTAERFKAAPLKDSALPLQELAVWSGDTVRMDHEGFLYFIGRNDDMIKVSGYRVSPTEIEEVFHATELISEVAAFGVPHPVLGQAIVAVVVPLKDRVAEPHALMQECRKQLPAYMVPAHLEIRQESLPRTPNGKIDRKSLRTSFNGLFD